METSAIPVDCSQPDRIHDGVSTAAGWHDWPAIDPCDYGAKADGTQLDTVMIQAAIDAASARRGGRVVLRGGTFLSGSIFLKPHTALVIDAGGVLKGTTEPRAYAKVCSRWMNEERTVTAGLVNATGIHGVRISGGGTIRGDGFLWWNAHWAQAGRPDKMDTEMRRVLEHEPGSAMAQRLMLKMVPPQPILITGCRDVLVEGIHIVDSPSWTLHTLFCEDVKIRQVTIRTSSRFGMHAPSTDGIDIDSCRNVHIHHCDVSCHDDNFCLKSGRGAQGAAVNRPTENVLIHDCVAREGHGLLALGTEFAGGLRNIIMRDCRAEGTQMGLRFKSNIGNGGAMENVVAENIVCTDVACPIRFRLQNNYAIGGKLPDGYVAGPAGIPHFRNFTFRNVKATGADTCVSMVAYADRTFDNVIFDNVELEGRAGVNLVNACNWDLRGLRQVRCAGGRPIALRDCANVTLPDWYDPGADYPPEAPLVRNDPLPPYHDHCGFC